MISFLDQRSTERYKVNANTAGDFASPVLEDFGLVNVVNISTTGVGFTTTEKVQVDLVFIIRLVNPPRKFARLALVRVTKVTEQPDGTCFVSGKFESPLSNDEFCILAM